MESDGPTVREDVEGTGHERARAEQVQVSERLREDVRHNRERLREIAGEVAATESHVAATFLDMAGRARREGRLGDARRLEGEAAAAQSGAERQRQRAARRPADPLPREPEGAGAEHPAALPEGMEQAPRQRDAAASERDEAARRRDEAAGYRDEAARRRDEAAAERDVRAVERPVAAESRAADHDADRGSAQRDRLESGRDRAAARGDREAAARDRAAAGADREQSEVDRETRY